MLKKKPAPVAMRRDELLRSVIDRVARANPTMDMEDIERIAMHAVNVLSHIQDLPRYS